MRRRKRLRAVWRNRSRGVDREIRHPAPRLAMDLRQSADRDHDASPRSSGRAVRTDRTSPARNRRSATMQCRSEEHTSELQSQSNLVCRLLLEKKKKKKLHKIINKNNKTKYKIY